MRVFSVYLQILGLMKKFLQSAVFLAISGLVAKAVGALFKVPLTNVLGAEGIGIYQLVFPVYTVLLALSGGGLPQAVSRMVSRCCVAGDAAGARRVLSVCMLALTAVGCAGTVMLLVFGHALALMQGNAAATQAYWALSPSVLFVSVLAVLRGYFQGKRNMFPTAISQLAEQVIKLFAGLFMAMLLLKYGLVSGVAGALIGVSISEAVSLGIIAVMYAFDRRKKQADVCADVQTLPARKILKEIYMTALPISLGALIMPLSQLIDSVMVVNLLKLSGQTVSEATSLYGIVTAPLSTLINLPTVVSAALAVSLIPCLASGNERETVSSHMRLASAAGGAGAAMLFVFGDELLAMLYGRGLSAEHLALASMLMKVSAISVFFVSVTQIMAAAMQAKGRANLPARNLLISAAFKAALTAVGVMTVGISGAVIATVLCYAVAFTLDYISLKKVVGGSYAAQITLPALCGFGAGAAAYLVKLVMNDCYAWLMFVIAGGVFALSFTASAYFTKSIRRADFRK